MPHMKIFVISDIHGEIKHLDSAAGMLGSADLVVVCGDFTGTRGGSAAADILSGIESYNSAVLAVHGNWDSNDVADLLKTKGCFLHAGGRIIDGVGFFGVGGSGKTPFKTPCEYSETEIEDFLHAGYREVPAAETTVLVSHCPPRKVRDRTYLGLRGGSAAVRKFIETNKIDLCLTGHIHEAFGVERLGGCTVVNSGTFKKGNYSYIEIGSSITVEQGKLRY